MFPVLFQINYIVVHTYGVFLALALLGFLFGVRYFLRYTKQPIHFFQKHFLWFCISFIVVAKLAYILFHIQEFSQRLWFFFSGSFSFAEIFQLLSYIISSGYLVTAGILGLLLYLYFACKAENQSFKRWADIGSLGFIIAFIIALIGAFLGGYYYGTPSDFPWAITFESSVHSPVKYLSPIHPIQLYGAILLLFFFVTLTRIFHHVKIPGFTSGVSMVLFSLLFFFLETIRGDSTPYGLLTLNQWLLLVLFGVGAVQLFRIMRKRWL